MYKFNPDWIVKVEVTGKDFQNAREWTIWKELEETQYAKWFAPCIDISRHGTFMIQHRTMMPTISQYPNRIPEFFTDTKYQNYGMMGKQFVCHDYGTLPTVADWSAKMVKADWSNGIQSV